MEGSGIAFISNYIYADDEGNGADSLGWSVLEWHLLLFYAVDEDNRGFWVAFVPISIFWLGKLEGYQHSLIE